jgi:hypothetical protein
MAIASFLNYTDPTLQPGGVNRISAATSGNSPGMLPGMCDMSFYDRAAYRRMQQVYSNEDVDYLLDSLYYPKASIEMLNMFEFGWWPLYVERTLGAFYYQQSQKTGQTVTAFTPAQLVKVNQTLVRLECFKVAEIFYSTIVTDNSNINEKDAANYQFARRRFEEEWQKAIQESYFYDLRGFGEIGIYQQSWLADPNFFEGDRRYF